MRLPLWHTWAILPVHKGFSVTFTVCSTDIKVSMLYETWCSKMMNDQITFGYIHYVPEQLQ
jgi:hypothetical protein